MENIPVILGPHGSCRWCGQGSTGQQSHHGEPLRHAGPCVSLGSWLLGSRAGHRAMVGTQDLTLPSRASNIAGAPGAQGCLSRTLAETRRTPLSKSTTTSRTLPSTHLVSMTPPGSHGVPGPPQVPGHALVSGLVPPRISLSLDPPAPKSLVLVQSHWLPSPQEQHVGRQIMREGAEECLQCHRCPHALLTLVSPQPLEQRDPRTLCPVSLHSTLSQPRWPHPPSRHTPGGLVPSLSPGLSRPGRRRPPALTRSPAGPAAPGPVPRLPINSSVQRAGLGTWAPPGAHPGRAGGPAAWPCRAPCHPKKGQQGDFPPRQNEEILKVEIKTLTPPQEMYLKRKLEWGTRGLQSFSGMKSCSLAPEKGRGGSQQK